MSRHDPFFNLSRELRRALIYLAIVFGAAIAYVLMTACSPSRRVTTDTDLSQHQQQTAEQQDTATVSQKRETITTAEVFCNGSSTSDSTALRDKSHTEQESHDHVELHYDSTGILRTVIADLTRRQSMQADLARTTLTTARQMEERLTAKTVECSELQAELAHYIRLHQEDSLRIVQQQTPVLTSNDVFYRRCGKIAVWFVVCVFIIMCMWIGYGTYKKLRP